jgi:ankyrin repeat protein
MAIAQKAPCGSPDQAAAALRNMDIEICPEAFMESLLLKDDTIPRLMIQAGLDPNSVIGESPLLLAAATEGNRDVVQALISAGADANTCDPKGTTPLMIACSAGWYATVSVLLKVKGIDVNAIDYNGLTALDWAQKSQQAWQDHKMNTKGHTAAIKLLKKAGAK